jgi:hypothetical protein
LVAGGLVKFPCNSPNQGVIVVAGPVVGGRGLFTAPGTSPSAVGRELAAALGVPTGTVLNKVGTRPRGKEFVGVPPVAGDRKKADGA